MPFIKKIELYCWCTFHCGSEQLFNIRPSLSYVSNSTHYVTPESYTVPCCNSTHYVTPEISTVPCCNSTHYVTPESSTVPCCNSTHSDPWRHYCTVLQFHKLRPLIALLYRVAIPHTLTPDRSTVPCCNSTHSDPWSLYCTLFTMALTETCPGQCDAVYLLAIKLCIKLPTRRGLPSSVKSGNCKVSYKTSLSKTLLLRLLY
jgi:hypothetical protein